MNLTNFGKSAALLSLAYGLAGSASADIDKLATYASMRAIAAEQQSIRGVPSEQNRSNELQAQFDALKASMGGDDPTTMTEAVTGATSASAKAATVAPTPPPGLIVTTTTVTNSTPTAIPTGPAVVTSTVLVAGAGPYLWDVDLSTSLTHTFAADLDITIQSPTGTVVTLTSDNGAGNDNVFNGTLWDDDANDPVTDHVYTNLVTATPLVPEEAFGAFRGEDPNGTWTITISDDLSGDGGSLDAWTLDLFTLTTAPIETSAVFSNATPVPIADVTTTSSTIIVAGAGTTLTAIDLTTAIQHTFSADMDITLQSPAGTIVTLSTDNGAGNDDIFNGTNWNDKANPAGQVPYTSNNGVTTDQLYANLTVATPLVVEEALSAFVGEDPNGTWTLAITDDLAGDTGTLNNWTLNITTGIGLLPLTSTPASGTPVALPVFTVGGAATTALVNFQNPNASAASVTCTTTGPDFTVAPSPLALPAAGNADVTVSFSTAVVGPYSDTLVCTGSGGEAFSFPLTGTAVAAPVVLPALAIPSLGMASRLLLVFGLLGFGLLLVRQRNA